ncbi:hypothetical protein GCM10007140_34440 [Priestia taiwanensis]|uniref:Uncharacterized protein n=1 Tax=Priestia taiwanensis TaxID=1347902 RepID=A0A917EU10_9BACI|nr:hypothetical protein GCM10007140_34440 [Priestia taiwanensis]
MLALLLYALWTSGGSKHVFSTSPLSKAKYIIGVYRGLLSGWMTSNLVIIINFFYFEYTRS